MKSRKTFMKIPKDIWVAFIVAVLISTVGVIPFVGLPGAIALVILDPGMYLLQLNPIFETLGPSGWGLGILLTFVLPWVFFIGYLIIFLGFKKWTKKRKWLVLFLFVYVIGLSIVWYELKGYKQPPVPLLNTAEQWPSAL